MAIRRISNPLSSSSSHGAGSFFRLFLAFGVGAIFGKIFLNDASYFSSSSSLAFDPSFFCPSTPNTTTTCDCSNNNDNGAGLSTTGEMTTTNDNDSPTNNNNDDGPTTTTSSSSPLQLLAPPSTIIPLLQRRFEWLDTISIYHDPKATTLDRARFAYSELIRMIVSGMAYGAAEKTVIDSLTRTKKPVAPVLNLTKRERGADWTYLGYSMSGLKRLHSLAGLMADVFQNKIPGDFIETGVWRGGSSIYAKAVMEAHGEDQRHIYVCDSFAGLPPGDKNLHKHDVGWDNNPFLEVSEELVRGHFAEANLLDERVHFVKGFFNDSMPELRKSLPANQKFAIMRLDGDMYQSTVDVLYTLYDRLSIGGYLIMDDWFGFPSKTACEDFFRVHNWTPKIIPIDGNAAYWKKTAEIPIQYWRYEQKKYKA